MNIKKIREEVSKAQNASFAKKTDKQLLAYELLSELYRNQNKGVQPAALTEYNKAVNRQCKLTVEKVKLIRSKYNPYVYGKDRLAKEFGVSTSVIYRIIKGKAWNDFEDSG